MEGIMMRNQDKYAIAVRKPDGEIEVITEPYRGIAGDSVLYKVPLVRGVLSFLDSLITGVHCLMLSASFQDDEEPAPESLSEKEKQALEEKRKKEEKGMMAWALLFALVLAVGLFILLPYALAGLLGKVIQTSWLVAFLEALLRVGIFLTYMILISRMKDIQRNFMYHGAEHKCINCIENGLELNIGNVERSSRQHKRCGTSFLFFVVLVSAVLMMFIQAKSRIWRLVIRLLLIPVIAGISYELIRLAGKSDNPAVRILSAPGLALQRLTTREPQRDQIEVAIAAVEAVFDWRAFQREAFGKE